METCHDESETSRPARPFLVAAYAADAAGDWFPIVIPKTCPTSGTGGDACQVGFDHLRPRKTGPRIPVAVLGCATHECRFTLYPCGHVPYGRESVAPVDLEGRPLADATDEDTQAGAGAFDAVWRQTRFRAVLDAAQGEAWPREGPGPCWTTQLQRLDELAALLGLFPVPSAPLGERLAAVLKLPRLSLLDDTRRLAQAHGFEERGGVLVATLMRATGRCILERVLGCGALTGLWRPVHLWEPALRGACRTELGGPSG